MPELITLFVVVPSLPSEIKFAALVLGLGADGIAIRIGRYDVHSKQVSTFESVVPKASLQPRSIPCSYEDDLQGQA